MSDTHQIDMYNDPAPIRDGDLPEPKPLAVTPYALSGTNFKDITSRAELIRELTKVIPVNEYGLPKHIYRPDLLDVNILVSSIGRGAITFVDEMIQASMLPILYTQGFPAVKGETPYWGRFDFESQEAFEAFLQYADQPGIRALHSEVMNAWSVDHVEEWFHLNYWFSRARALDQFRTAHHRRLRERRIMDLEDNHYIEGEKIFKRLVAAIGNKDDAALQDMDVDKLISSLERVTKIQRQSVGLSATGGNEGQAKSSSVEVIMRDVAESNTPKELPDSQFDITLLQDPDILDKAQELIIRVNK